MEENHLLTVRPNTVSFGHNLMRWCPLPGVGVVLPLLWIQILIPPIFIRGFNIYPFIGLYIDIVIGMLDVDPKQYIGFYAVMLPGDHNLPLVDLQLLPEYRTLKGIRGKLQAYPA